MRIECANGCYIAYHMDPDEAAEIAFERDAVRDNEADIWTCGPCYDGHIADMLSELPVLEAEASLRAMQDDAHENGPMVAYLRAKGQL